jgi:hypothetical protein
MNDSTFTSEIGAYTDDAVLIIELIACGGGILTTLLAFLLMNNTAVKVFAVLSRNLSILGILIWGLISLIFVLGGSWQDTFGIWCVLTFVVHLVSFVLLFFRRKINTNKQISK